MVHKKSWPIFLGLLVLSFAATPNSVMAQTDKTDKTDKTEESDEVAKRLVAARKISAASGKPIMAIVSNLDTT